MIFGSPNNLWLGSVQEHVSNPEALLDLLTERVEHGGMATKLRQECIQACRIAKILLQEVHQQLKLDQATRHRLNGSE